jgi:hypothetical protein
MLDKTVLRESIEAAKLDTTAPYDKVSLVDGELVFEEATSPFIEFDRFIVWISYFLEDQTIMFQSLLNGEIKAIEIYNGQAYRCDIVVNVLPKELIEL